MYVTHTLVSTYPYRNIIIRKLSGTYIFERKCVHMNLFVVKNGKRDFSEVRTFLKRKPYDNATYLTLTTEEGNQVTMAGNHLVFASRTKDTSDMEAR